VHQEENGDEEGFPLEDLGGTTARFVGRLDQYIASYYLRILFFAMISAYLIYALVESKYLMDGLLRTGQPFGLVLRYYPYFVPGVLYVVLPISCLIGAVVTFTLLTRSGELTAIKSSGISMRRATVSVLLLSAALSAVLYLVQDRIAPGTNPKAQAIRDQIMGNAPRTHGTLTLGRWLFAPQGRHLYHYQLFDPDTQEFQGVNVFTVDRRTPRILDHRFAELARWTGSEWELRGGWYRTFPADGSAAGTTFERFEDSTLAPLDSPEEVLSNHGRRRSANALSEQLGTRDLSAQIEKLERSGYDTTKLRVAFHGKIARSFTPFVMVLLGLPFAFKVGRRGSLYGIGVAFVLVLVYWAVMALFNALGLETVLEPWVAAWAPNVLFGLFGVYLMLYVRT
jgi:LPS export ABC transporter permease LptG